MTNFTAWELLLYQFEASHEANRSRHQANQPNIPGLFGNYISDLTACPDLSEEERSLLRTHLHDKSDRVEQVLRSKNYSEEAAVELLEDFSLVEALKTREVNLKANLPGDSDSKGSFQLWRQDDNGNEFMISEHQSELEAQLLRKRLERRGHKQHYWVKVVS